MPLETLPSLVRSTVRGDAFGLVCTGRMRQVFGKGSNQHVIPQPLDMVPLFSALSEEEREQLYSRLRRVEFNTNETIFSATKPADMMGVVVQGWVKLEGVTAQGALPLANLGAGSLIGEVDVLLNRPYSTFARAATATTILALYRSDLQDLILQYPSIGLKFSIGLGSRIAYLDDYIVTQRLSTNPLFSSLSDADRRTLASRLQFRSYQRGDTIFQAGDAPEALYLIESGTVRLITRSNEGESFDELGVGELIGLTAVVTGRPYPSTAFATSDVNVWTLGYSEYTDLISVIPTIKLALSRALAEPLGAEEQEEAIRRLQAMPLFADADRAAVQAIVERLVLRHYPAGELIYAEGTPGDAMYFVQSGRVRLVSDAATEATLLDRVEPGESFGEMALFTGRTRGEAARAYDDTTLWVLYKSEYEDLMIEHPALSLALSRALSTRLGGAQGDFVERHLRELSLFAGLSQSELREVAQFVKPLRFRPGETICVAGQPANYVYIIEAGEARQIAMGPNGQTIVLDLLGPQQSFGEQAVVQSSTYPVTVQAVGEVELWTIGKNEFDRALAKYPALALSVTRRMAEELDQARRRGTRVQMAPPVRPPATPQSATPRASSATGYMSQPGAPAGQNSRSGTPQPIPTSPPVASQPTQARAQSPLPSTSVGVRTVPSRPWERGGAVMRPMPAATARPVQTAPAAAPSYVKRRRSGAPRESIFKWFSKLSTGNKIAAALIALFALWIVVMLPLWMIYAVLTSGALGGSGGAPANELPFNVGGNRPLLFGNKVAIGVRTPTPTPLPPTPEPPTATPTRRPARVATRPPEPQQPAEAAPASDPSLAQAAAVSARPLPPVEWDSRVGPGGLPLLQGVGVEKVNVTPGQQFWRLIALKFEDAGAESGNDHTIYIALIDENGQRVDDKAVEVSWDQAGAIEVQRLSISDQKPKGDYCNCNYNWPMYGAAYRVRVDDSIPSDMVYGMIMPMKRHVNYRLTFQRVVQP